VARKSKHPGTGTIVSTSIYAISNVIPEIWDYSSGGTYEKAVFVLSHLRLLSETIEYKDLLTNLRLIQVPIPQANIYSLQPIMVF
jgi:hypothetical protein